MENLRIVNGQLGAVDKDGMFVPYTGPIPITIDGNGQHLTPDEIEAEHKEHERTALKHMHQNIWLNYSVISMQCVKFQSDSFSDPKEIAIKAARLADLMLEQYCQRE